jgi:hypothetical protein
MKKNHRTKNRFNQFGRNSGNGIKLWIIFVVVLAGIPFLLGKYIEFNSPGPFDSASNVYSAKRIVDGARIGFEEKPSAATGTLIVNIIGVRLFGFSETGPKLVQGILQAAALVLMFWAMRKLFGTPAAVLGVIIASVYLSAPLIAKFGNVKEQYMVAFMVLGVSCYVLSQLEGWWWMKLLAGGFLSWAPLFKETGYSVIAAVGLFVIVQPVLKKRTWKKTAADIGFLTAGVAIAISPLYIWILTGGHRQKLPYSFVWKPVVSVFKSSDKQKSDESETGSGAQDKKPEGGLVMKILPGYVRQSWQILKPEQRKEVVLRILRYYRLLILPILLALGAIVIRLVRLFRIRFGPSIINGEKEYERFVLLFAVWWLLDMAFVWVSPRSYEQYYLPLNASAAMLGGYLMAIYYDSKVKDVVHKPKWVMIGLVGVMLMIIMSWHIFFGIETSPHSGTKYGQKRRGYLQKMSAISERGTATAGSWQLVGRYIRENSRPNDKIYVWGWVPGIYLEAQRVSCAPKAFESDMHRKSPEVLGGVVEELLTAFRKEPPRFIVDTYKRHFPWDRPPLELWPVIQNQIAQEMGVKPADAERAYGEWLRRNIGEDEAKRFEAMRPFRRYVAQNYNVVRSFGEMLLFQLKKEPRLPVKRDEPANKEQ